MSGRPGIVLVNVTAVLIGVLAPAFAGQAAPPAAKAPARQASSGPARPAKPAKPAKSYVPPKTIYGQPDLQGVWNFVSQITPFERPRELGDKAFYTVEEAAAVEKRRAETTPCGSAGIGRLCNPDIKQKPVEEANINGEEYDQDFFSPPALPLTKTLRTSQVIDPPDGRLPPLTPQAQKRYDAWYSTHFGTGGGSALKAPRTAEDFELTHRCIGFHHGPTFTINDYDAHVEFIQGRDTFVFDGQLHSYARVVPMDGRPHLPPALQQWWGDSRGRWEGNTLVVETINFKDDHYRYLRGADQNLKLTERFTRVEPDVLLYEYTVDNPTAYTRPWTAAFYMKKADDLRVYPYDCISSNRVIALSLGAARAEEKAAAEAAAKKNAQ